MREKLTYANVMSTIAVVLALGGGAAYAANTIGTDDVINESLLSEDIKDGEIRALDIADGNVLFADIGVGQVGSSRVADNSLGGVDILDGSLSAPDLAASAVPADGAGTNGSTKVATSAIDRDEIALDGVGASEVAANAIDSDELVDGGVGAADIAAAAVGASEIADGSITNAEVGNGALGAGKLKIGARLNDVLDLAVTVPGGGCSNFANASAPQVGTTASGAITLVTETRTGGFRAEGTTTTSGAARVRICNGFSISMDPPPVTFSWITIAN